ncbi:MULTISPECIES: hypothetical protein [unclassified Croceicoccus]|uniref:hypothetical protein n=1 Tax=unclassified Croceicoccus TaxID=2629967 RepID=UPI001E60D5D7|nr:MULTISPECIES: hypothetical protein [unclassified Croceicoccus]
MILIAGHITIEVTFYLSISPELTIEFPRKHKANLVCLKRGDADGVLIQLDGLAARLLAMASAGDIGLSPKFLPVTSRALGQHVTKDNLLID